MKLKRRARWLVAVIGATAGIVPTAAGTSSPHVVLTQINMSHDLVALGIAAQNLTPNNPALDARPLIQAALNYVQTHPVQVLTVDTGAYYLLSSTQANAVLFFPRLSNMTVDLAGSTIYFAGPFLPNGIQLFQCQNFTLKNFQTDFVSPPYTHVQIASVDANQRQITYAPLPGWPNPATLNGLAVEGYWAAFFRNGAVVPGTSRTLLTGPFSGNTLVLTQDTTPWTQAPTLATLQPGDTVVVTARGGGAPLLVWEGDGITLLNISVYGSPTWAVALHAVSNSVVDGVRIVPRPGTGLIGSNADGIHFESVRQNNHIRNCYVTRTMDDALIMDSLYAATIVSQLGPRQLRVTRNIYLRFPNGTPVSFIDPLTTLETAGPTITAQNPADSDSVAFNGQVDLTFDQDLPPLSAGMGMAYGSPAMRGQGSSIEDNLVENLYGGRGVWIPGVKGVTVRRNVVRRTSMAGISVETDTLANNGPPAHDVVITDNSLEGALGPAAVGNGEQNGLGAIEVVATNNQAFGFASASSHTNITIANNYIADSGRSGMWVGELNGGLLQNNLVLRSNQNPTMGGIYGIPPPFQAQVAADALLPVVIRYSTGVSEIGDTIIALSPIAAPVSFSTPSVPVPSAGGQASLNLATAVTGFGWKATASDSWITFTSADSGTGAGTLSYGVAPNSSGARRTGTITVAGQVFVVVQAARDDVAWRHATRGEVWRWSVNGAVLTAQTYIASVDVAYDIVGRGDFNGDGHRDLLWRHKTTGDVWIWLMNGDTPSGQLFVSTVDPSYDIVGTGDYNGDGKSDILWRHAGNGQVWIWLMNGASTLSVVHVDTVDPLYRIDGSGDLNADGKSDIVWRNTISGDVWVWLMNGTSRISQTMVGTVPDLNYQIVGVADYTGDGKADILWRHTTQGHVWIWPMNGASVVSQTFVDTVDSIYAIVGTGDYNGDGKADILWHHSTVGDVWVWLMNGAVMTSQTLVGQVPDVGYKIVKSK